MPTTRCNNKEFMIDGYQVTATPGEALSDLVTYALVDPQKSLNDHCRILKILWRVHKDQLLDNALDVPSGCNTDDCCECYGDAEWTFVQDLKALTIENAALFAAVSAGGVLTVTVPLPMTEANVFI